MILRRGDCIFPLSGKVPRSYSFARCTCSIFIICVSNSYQVFDSISYSVLFLSLSIFCLSYCHTAGSALPVNYLLSFLSSTLYQFIMSIISVTELIAQSSLWSFKMCLAFLITVILSCCLLLFIFLPILAAFKSLLNTYLIASFTFIVTSGLSGIKSPTRHVCKLSSVVGDCQVQCLIFVLKCICTHFCILWVFRMSWTVLTVYCLVYIYAPLVTITVGLTLTLVYRLGVWVY